MQYGEECGQQRVAAAHSPSLMHQLQQHQQSAQHSRQLLLGRNALLQQMGCLLEGFDGWSLLSWLSRLDLDVLDGLNELSGLGWLSGRIC